MTKPLLRYNDRDAYIMALTLYGEARGLPKEGQVKVAWVIRNRAERAAFAGPRQVGSEGAVSHVCTMPWQFSCWNESDPNSAKLNYLLRQYDEHQIKSVDVQPQLDIATAVLEGIVEDLTGGADHYHTVAKPGWATQWPPYWTKAFGVTARDPGNHGHVFYSSLVKPEANAA
jgi:N-acetylmuramoyl-L-alanine amidase